MHPGKDEFMTTGYERDPACWTPSSCEDVGSVDTDGGARMDTTMRIIAVAKVWSKLWKPLINSGLTLKEPRSCVYVGGLGSSLVRVKSESVV